MGSLFKIPGIHIDTGALFTSKPFLNQVTKALPDELQREAARVMDTKLGRKVAGLLPEQLEDAFGTLLGGRYDSGDVVDDIERRNDPQQTIHWDIQLPDAVSNLPKFYVEDVFLHQKQTEVREYHRSNSVRYDPGFIRYDGVSLVLYEDIRGRATRFFRNWSQLVERNCLYGRPSEYKKTMIVTMHDPKKVVSVKATIRKCWPITVNGYNLQSEGSDRIRLEVQFVNEIIKWEITGNGDSGTSDWLAGIGINLDDPIQTGNANANRFLNAALDYGVKKLFRI